MLELEKLLHIYFFLCALEKTKKQKIQNIMGYHGISCDIMGCHGISWDIMGYHGISWDIIGYHGISWDIM